MIDSVNIRLSNEQITESTGFSLSKTLYNRDITVTLEGELGAGKTTFVRGFLAGLGISERVTSPTFALEQRYMAANGTPVLHIDLYRLEEARARELLAGSEGFEGIRCIEWPERAGTIQADIRVALKEEGDGRLLTVTFDDIPLPSTQTVRQWQQEVMLPEHIIRHCDAVAELCGVLGEHLLLQGVLLRPALVQKSAELHDLLRFVDFGEGKPVTEVTANSTETGCWDSWKERFKGLRHEEACAAFLRQQGFDALSDIIAVHGLRLPPTERATIEQKLLFYADKRVKVERVVSLDERFDDFRIRYNEGAWTEQGKIWFEEAKNIETELFQNGLPA